MNKDYTYCRGVGCPIKKTCKRYNDEAIRASEPLCWLEISYEQEAKECTAIDVKPIKMSRKISIPKGTKIEFKTMSPEELAAQRIDSYDPLL